MSFKSIYNKWHLINPYVVYFLYNMTTTIECRTLTRNPLFQYLATRDDELHQTFVVGADTFDTLVDTLRVVIHGVLNISHCKWEREQRNVNNEYNKKPYSLFYSSTISNWKRMEDRLTIENRKKVIKNADKPIPTARKALHRFPLVSSLMAPSMSIWLIFLYCSNTALRWGGLRDARIALNTEVFVPILFSPACSNQRTETPQV